MAAPAQVAHSDHHTIQLQESSCRISTPRQEHQVDCFLSVFEERLARRANLRTHGKGTSKINELAGAHGYGKVGRDFARADRVPEPTFHQRSPAGGRVLQEPPDLRVVHKGRDAHEKASLRASSLGCRLDGVLQEAGEPSHEASAATAAPSRRERLSFPHNP